MSPDSRKKTFWFFPRPRPGLCTLTIPALTHLVSVHKAIPRYSAASALDMGFSVSFTLFSSHKSVTFLYCHIQTCYLITQYISYLSICKVFYMLFCIFLYAYC